MMGNVFTGSAELARALLVSPLPQAISEQIFRQLLVEEGKDVWILIVFMVDMYLEGLRIVYARRAFV